MSLAGRRTRLGRGLGLALALGLAVALAWGGLVWARAPVTVRVLMPAPFADATAELVDAFNRGQRNVRLAVTRGPFETESVSDLAISSLLLGDSPYDLLLMDVTWTAKYAAAGWLLPLDDWLGPDALAPLAPGAREGNRIDGRLWRVPLVADMGLLYWRTDLMDEPPRTPAELVAVSRDLQRRGQVRWGYVWQGRQYEGLSCVFLEVLHGFGGTWGPVGPGFGLDSAAATEAATWLRSLIDTGVSPPAVANFAEPEALQSFEAGEAAFLRNWPYAWQELQGSGSRVAGKVGVTTMVAEPGRSPGATQGSWGLSVLAGSRHPAEAVQALQALTGPASQRRLVERWGYTPTLTALFDDPELVAQRPLLPVLRAALEDAVLRPINPGYAQLSDIVQRQLSGVITGDTAPGKAMARAGRASRQLLEASGQRAASGREVTP
ncbi:ABC transporter substrate-binding protein [Cyanobium sp. NIES-981]|uniref:ABC transporter substrate-binding protein n=1 Tax=Cyanobium sp. NIES-981 TaxID=1851505 RepID=UPI0007DCE8AF|nr:ABC transporter substrate-binding protein [Cyanobium sp. NIES-981]SBO43883.1 ABC transporter, likely sugar solute binding protein [Cyanobium sp. NIES-981]